jgi:hypothetical protein
MTTASAAILVARSAYVALLCSTTSLLSLCLKPNKKYVVRQSTLIARGKRNYAGRSMPPTTRGSGHTTPSVNMFNVDPMH